MFDGLGMAHTREDQPLDLCTRTTKEKSNKSNHFSDESKSVDNSLNAFTSARNVRAIEENKQMVQTWLQRLPTDMGITAEFSQHRHQSNHSVNGHRSTDSETSDNPDITVSLQNRAMWRSFSQEGTEMIINKSGRRMYPRVAITLGGLVSSSMYSVEMTVIQADDKRYKYKDNLWSVVGKSMTRLFSDPCKHPSSPASGSYWMQDTVSFYRVKLSNHLGPDKICLESMHKYLIQINVIHHCGEDRRYTFTIPGTDFIAVTAYLNKQITKLKISHNPFARAFKNKPGTANENSSILDKKRKNHPNMEDDEEADDDDNDSPTFPDTSSASGSNTSKLAKPTVTGATLLEERIRAACGGKMSGQDGAAPPWLCLVTSSGMYYQPYPYWRPPGDQ